MRKCLAALAVVMISACCIGCAPMPMRKLYKSPNGETRRINVEPMRPGITTRADLQRDLGWVEVPTGLGRLFWARYSTSDKALAVLGPPPYIGGGRWWSDKNLVATLDENGIVAGQQTVGDEKLLAVFTQALKEIKQQPPDFSQGISVAALPSRYSPYERLLLTPDHISFFRVGAAVATQVSTSDIREISVVCSFCSWESLSIQVVLKSKTRLTCDVQLKDVVTTVQWMRATLTGNAQRPAADSGSGHESFVPQPICDSGH